MKIAMLHYSAPPTVGGVENVLAQHASMMARGGHFVAILTGRGKPFNESVRVMVLPDLDSRHPEILSIKSKLDNGILPEDFDVMKKRIMGELMPRLKGFDILIAHNIASLHKNLPLTAALHELYQLSDFPRLILWHHDFAWTNPLYSDELHEGYPWNLLRSTWQGATHVVVSESRRRELSGLLVEEKVIHVIPNGVDMNTFYKLDDQTIQFVNKLKLNEADPLFLLPVRLTPRKNIELALNILVHLRKEYPKVALVITGPEGAHNPENQKYKQKLLDLRNSLNLQGAVHFLAEISSEEIANSIIADLYRISDALLFPSTAEGFGIPLIEAAFSSKPVFCSDIAVLRELGGRDVNYFETSEDPAIIALKIKETLENNMTSRWARRAKHKYTWDSVFNCYISPLLKAVTK